MRKRRKKICVLGAGLLGASPKSRRKGVGAEKASVPKKNYSSVGFSDDFSDSSDSGGVAESSESMPWLINLRGAVFS